MKRNVVIAVNLVLLVWFFLDMTGLDVGGRLLVSRAYREDGVFFLIYLVLFSLFLFKGRMGGYLLLGWLTMWFLTQFTSHWVYTIFGPSEDKMAYFSETIKFIPSTDIYIPDLYHIVLHVLILLAWSSVWHYLARFKKTSIMKRDSF